MTATVLSQRATQLAKSDGTIATNAGGDRTLRWRMARDRSPAPEVVLADGSVVPSLSERGSAPDTRLAVSRDHAEIDMMGGIKNLVDPDHRLNRRARLPIGSGR